MARELDLVVVMPVYNEAEGIAACVASWLDMLAGLGVRYELLVIDDGSSDATAGILSGIDGVTLEQKANEGHGPTIMRGYLSAVPRAEWILQVDSDDEIPASAFPKLWAARQGHDAVLGVRVGRSQSLVRRVMSVGAKWTIRLAYGGRLRDVNCPCRLMRADVLGPIVERIPVDTFAPNPAIAGAMVRAGARVAEVEVPFQPRTTGSATSLGAKAPRVFIETVRLAARLR